MTIEIRQVDADVVRPLRHAVLRHGADPEESVYPADDLAATVHLAVYEGGDVVGTATLFPEHYEGCPAWRLRGMAVAEAHRGTGLGSMLLAEIRALVHERGGDLLWCNARTAALTFYTGHGFIIVGDEFLVAQGVPHYRAILDLSLEYTPSGRPSSPST